MKEGNPELEKKSKNIFLGYHSIISVLNQTRVKAESNEQGLLKRLGQNDNEAMEIVYKDNFPMVQSFILQNNGNYDDARDVFQEAMIVLYENAKKDSFVLTAQIKTYVYSVCRRIWLKRLQQLGRFTTPVESLSETVPVEEEIAEQEQKNVDFALMEDAMHKLGEPCRGLIEAYYIHKKGMVEIASQFGYTNADNAKNQKYKCLVRLKKLFFSQYKNGE